MDNTTSITSPAPDILYDLSAVYLAALGFAGALLCITALIRLFRAIKVSFVNIY